jgi:hypothetical protein
MLSEPARRIPAAQANYLTGRNLSAKRIHYRARNIDLPTGHARSIQPRSTLIRARNGQLSRARLKRILQARRIAL